MQLDLFDMSSIYNKLILNINMHAIIIFKTSPLYLMERKCINTSYLISSMKIIGINFSPLNNKNDKKNNKQDEISLQLVFSCYILIGLNYFID